MTPYLQILSRLLQAFWQINKATDFVSLFKPVTITEITAEEDREYESLSPIPIQLHLFSFKDTDERIAELELNLKKDTEELVNARIQIFFTDTAERDKYFQIHIEPYFSKGFQRGHSPKHHSLPVRIRKYYGHGLLIGLNFEADAPFISTYVTLEGII